MARYPFPKCLLPVCGRPILWRIIECWQPFVDRIVLVHNPLNGRILQQYTATYYRGQIPIQFVLQARPTGTYDAVQLALAALPAERFVLNWSDICLDEPPPDAVHGSQNVVFTSDVQAHCRWVFQNGRFIRRDSLRFDGGGVYGVFAINNPQKAFLAHVERERNGETEILAALDGRAFLSSPHEAFTDIGEASRYGRTTRIACSISGPRAFGSGATIESCGDRVVKTFADDVLRETEANWYRAARFPFVPHVRSERPLTLQRVDGEPCWKWLHCNSSPQDEARLIRRVFDLVGEVHLSRPSIPVDLAACRQQYFDKTIERLQRVEFLFADFHRRPLIVNGLKCQHPIELLRQHLAAVRGIFPDRFHFIHGDVQLSNMLIDRRDRLFLIDPRGVFGGIPLFGDALYDYAKFYYGLCGYDIFCTGRNELSGDTSSGFTLAPLMPPAVVERRRKKFATLLQGVPYLRRGMAEIDLAHALIWLSATDYIANDVLSSLYAYLHGTELLNRSLAVESAIAAPAEQLSAA